MVENDYPESVNLEPAEAASHLAHGAHLDDELDHELDHVVAVHDEVTVVTEEPHDDYIDPSTKQRVRGLEQVVMMLGYSAAGKEMVNPAISILGDQLTLRVQLVNLE